MLRHLLQFIAHLTVHSTLLPGYGSVPLRVVLRHSAFLHYRARRARHG